MPDAFRRELALIPAEVARAGTGVGAQPRVNCLTGCAGLHSHHTGEPLAIVPLIAGSARSWCRCSTGCPASTPIAELVAELRSAVAGPAEPAQLQRAVGRLTEELERHLAHDEEQLVPALAALTP